MTHLSVSVLCVPRRLTLRNEDQSALNNASDPSRTTDGGRREDLCSQDVDRSARMRKHGSARAPRKSVLLAAVLPCENTGIIFPVLSCPYCSDVWSREAQH